MRDCTTHRTASHPGEVSARLTFDSHCLSKDGASAHPTVRSATVVPDEESASIDRLDQVEVVGASNADQDDIANDECVGITRIQCYEVAVIYLATHGVSTRADLHGFTTCESLFCKMCPTQ